jgi:DNA-binding transcriptional ArsR family regulator
MSCQWEIDLLEILIDGTLKFRYIVIQRYRGTMKEFITFMKALSDPNRVKIVKMLQRRMLCICEIQEALGLAQSTASKHQKILENSGIIEYSKERRWVNYRLADGPRAPMWLACWAICATGSRKTPRSSV